MNRLVRLTWHIYEMLSGLVLAAKAWLYPHRSPEKPPASPASCVFQHKMTINSISPATKN
jgi:hypothetical protein